MGIIYTTFGDGRKVDLGNSVGYTSDGSTNTNTNTSSNDNKVTVGASSGGSAGAISQSNLQVADPVAGFVYEILDSGVVAFTDQSLNSPKMYLWNFGDGKTSTAKNPIHQYSIAGNYTVKLITQNAGGIGIETKTVTVTMKNKYADFSYVISGLKVFFTNTSTVTGTYLWNFGDGKGTTSTEKNPTHAYTRAGDYTVRLTVNGTLIKTKVVSFIPGILLDWIDNSDDEDNFVIERSPNGSTGWVELITLGVGITSRIVVAADGIDPLELHYFRVKATNEVGSSTYTNTISSECGG